MSKTEMTPPPEIVRAVETLEQAVSPVELGPTYKEVLDWRSQWPRRTFGARLSQIGSILGFFGAFFLLRSTGVEISDFWNGFVAGAAAILVLTSLRDWSSRRSHVTMTFVERVDEAIDRWRHAVPAMRDFPK
jgi:hypothetical protein